MNMKAASRSPIYHVAKGRISQWPSLLGPLTSIMKHLLLFLFVSSF